MEEILQKCISESLDNHLYSNGLFLAERLYANSPSEENLYILANIYYLMGKPNQTYLLLQCKSNNFTLIKNKYLFSQCCFELNKYQEAELYLGECCNYFEKKESDDGLSNNNSTSNCYSSSDFNKPCNIASIFYLMGMVYKKLNQKEKSIQYFKKSLYIYPYLWISYEQLCTFGNNDIDPNDFFIDNNNDNINNNNNNNISTVTGSNSNQSLNMNIIKSNFISTPSFLNKSNFSTLDASFATPIHSKQQQQQPKHIQSNYHHHLPPQLLPHQLQQTIRPTGRLNYITPQTPHSQFTPIVPNKFSNLPQSPIPLIMETPEPKSSQHFTPSPSVSAIKKSNDNIISMNINTISTNNQNQIQSQPIIPKLKKKSEHERSKLPDKSTPVSNLKKPLFTSNEEESISSISIKKEKHVSIGETQTQIFTNDYEDDEIDTDDHDFMNGKLTFNIGQFDKDNSMSYYDDYDYPNNPNHNNNNNNNNNLTFNNLSQNNQQQKQQMLEQQQYLIGNQELLELLLIIARGYKLLTKYSCKEAIEQFKQLPDNQYQTGWVLTRVGKCYFEMVDYKEAKKVYEQVRDFEPYRLEGMEIYSTILWHLKQEVELSYLAHQLVEIDRLSPQVWCVVGNCFSLQKDHESSLKIFKRSIQLDPNFTYAYTLSGHEYLSNDDLDNALNSYRMAIKIDQRHYNSWYGIGLIYFRQEKYDLAEYHFKKAIQINCKSSVLYCYLGMSMQANKKFSEALSTLNKSIELQPKNTLAKFKRASILYTIERYNEALTELEQFRELTPKETPIYILLGKVYKKLGNIDKARESLITALDLDPKNSNTIRSFIDKLHLQDDFDNQNFEL